jgi:hypothetical protein
MSTDTNSVEVSDRRAMLDVLRRLRAALLLVVPTGSFIDGTPAHGVILSMYWRTVRHYDAIVILLENHLPEEAAALSRPLFEESLKLMELGADSERRLALIAQHVQDAITQQRNLFDNRADLDAQARLNEVEQKMADFAKRSGVGKFAEFLSPKAGADRFNRSADWDFYRLTHQFVHGTDVAVTFSREQTSPGELAIRDRTNTLWVQLGVATFASLSLVEATRGTSQVFGWQGVDGLVSIQDELDAIQRRVHRP